MPNIEDTECQKSVSDLSLFCALKLNYFEGLGVFTPTTLSYYRGYACDVTGAEVATVNAPLSGRKMEPSVGVDLNTI